MGKAKVGKRKGGRSELETLFMAGLVKSFLEPLAAQYIGNATMFSGAVKLAGAMGVSSVMGRNKMTEIIQMALAIDGVEDIVYSLRSGQVGGILPTGGSGSMGIQGEVI